MWPLVCNEIGLSYDQEDRIRHRQRSVLSNSRAWIHRHTALATKRVIVSVATALAGEHEAAKRREKSLMSVLTPEQQVRFMAWVGHRSDAVRRLAESKLRTRSGVGGGRAKTKGGGTAAVGDVEPVMDKDEDEDEYKTSPGRHISANLYIIDHRLSKVKQRIPPDTPTFVPPEKLKKLSRRPSFESLAGRQGELEGSNAKQLNRESSFPSTGSLKRSLDAALGSDRSMDPSAVKMNSSQNNVTPESAYAAGQTAAMAVLNGILPIVPKSALCHSPSPNLHNTAFPSPPTVLSTQSQSFHRTAATPLVLNSQPATHRALSQQHYSLSLPLKTARTAPPIPAGSNDVVDDIPMPTPVSVLLRTSDDFIMESYEEPLHAAMPSGVAPTESNFAVPEMTTSYSYVPDTSASATGTGLLLSNHHQSAPQLYSSPSPIYSLPSIPESSCDNPTVEQANDSSENPVVTVEQTISSSENPVVNQQDVKVEDDTDVLIDLALEDLPEIQEDDWAIGEGFDMDVDQEGAT